MPRYSDERKQFILTKLLSPQSQSIAEIARTEGISPQTLYDWRNKARASGVFMPNHSSFPCWDKHTKLQVVIESAALNAEELSAYCREKGVYPEQIEQWRSACLEGVSAEPVDPKAIKREVRQLKKDKKTLERELRRKDKALAESAALLVLSKKYNALMMGEEDE